MLEKNLTRLDFQSEAIWSDIHMLVEFLEIN